MLSLSRQVDDRTALILNGQCLGWIVLTEIKSSKQVRLGFDLLSEVKVVREDAMTPEEASNLDKQFRKAFQCQTKSTTAT